MCGKKKIMTAAAVILAGALLLAGCGSGAGADSDSADGSKTSGDGSAKASGLSQYEDPDARKFLLCDPDEERNVEMGQPDKPLDPEKIYSGLTYIPEMFHGTYQIPGGNKAVEKFMEESDWMEYPQYSAIMDRTSIREIGTLPYKIDVGPRSTMGAVITGPGDMQMSFKDRDGNLVWVTGDFEIDGNRIRLTATEEKSYSEEEGTIYGPSDFVLEYEFAFKGTALTLTKDGKSVTLHAEYSVDGTEEYLNVTCFLKPGTTGIDVIDCLSFHWEDGDKGKYNRFYAGTKDPEYATAWNYYYGSVARLSEDGLFTFTVNYEDGPKTYQYVYFYGCRDGLVLTDGENTYLYTFDQSMIWNYKLDDVVDEEVVVDDLSESKVEELIETQDTILDDLNTAFTESEVNANVDADTGKVTLDANFLFAVDDATLSDEGKAYLDNFLDVYSSVILDEKHEGDVAKILVEGHTDPSGSYEYNMDLSERRAQSVVDYCLERNPALADFIEAKGCSYDDPVYTETGEVDMAASRRVLFKFILNVE